MPHIEYTYDTPGNYTYDSNLIELSASVAKLKLTDFLNQEFNEDFVDDTGFTYDSDLVEFTGVQVQQVSQVDDNEIYFHNFSQIDANRSLDNPTITGAGVSGGYLICSTGDVGSIAKENLVFGDGGNQGTIVARIKPNFTGGFPTTFGFGYIFNGVIGGFANRLLPYANGTNLKFEVGPADGSANYYVNSTIPTLDATKEYIFFFVVDCNGVGRESQIWFKQVDGAIATKIGTLNSSGYSRSNTFDRDLAINSSSASLVDINYYAIYNRVLTPTEIENWEEPTATTYLESEVELPQFAYSGLGSVQQFTNAIALGQSGAPHYTANGTYWDGAAWSASDGSYAQSNDGATFVTNITTLAPSDTLDTSVIFANGDTQGTLSDLTLEFTGQHYSPDDPTIVVNSGFRTDEITTMSHVIVKSGLDDIKYVLRLDSTDYYYDGVDWVESDGSYAQTNSVDEILTALSDLEIDDSGVMCYIVAFLHSDDGSTTPEIDTVSFNYNYQGAAPSDPELCVVDGFIRDVNNQPLSGVTITFEIDDATFVDAKNLIISRERIEVTTDSIGYFVVELIRSSEYLPDATYTVTYEKKAFHIIVPDQDFAELKDLV